MLVKLKMKPIYKSLLSLLGIIIIVCSVLLLLFMAYKDKLFKESYIDVDGYLSINYIEGKDFEITDEEVLTFSVANGNSETLYYNIGLLEVSGKCSYVLYGEDDKELEKGNLDYGDVNILENIGVDGEKTTNYKIKITNKGDNPLRGSINISIVESVVVTFADNILKNSEVVDNPLTKPGKELATTNEGLVKDEDDYGESYYFRGNVTNNYVKIGNLNWRIVRINSDDTVRLVLDGVTDNVSAIYTSGKLVYDFDKSLVVEYLDTWLTDNLTDYESFIASAKYCNDTVHDASNVFQSYTRLSINQIPTLSCIGDVYSGNIGLLTADEAILAGGMLNQANNSYYLFNGSITEQYYTMTGSSGDANMMKNYMIEPNGSITVGGEASLYRGVRPVINIIKNVEVIGTGTVNDPYVISK